MTVSPISKKSMECRSNLLPAAVLSAASCMEMRLLRMRAAKAFAVVEAEKMKQCGERGSGVCPWAGTMGAGHSLPMHGMHRRNRPAAAF